MIRPQSCAFARPQGSHAILYLLPCPRPRNTAVAVVGERGAARSLGTKLGCTCRLVRATPAPSAMRSLATPAAQLPIGDMSFPPRPVLLLQLPQSQTAQPRQSRPPTSTETIAATRDPAIEAASAYDWAATTCKHGYPNVLAGAQAASKGQEDDSLRRQHRKKTRNAGPHALIPPCCPTLAS